MRFSSSWYSCVMLSILSSSSQGLTYMTPAQIFRGSRPSSITRIPATQLQQTTQQPPSIIYSSSTRLYSATSSHNDIATMRAGEMKKELESYGISTASFVEKSELVQALEKARADGLQPKAATTATDASKRKKKKRNDDTNNNIDTPDVEDTRPREERLKEEIEKCQAMKASELKQELKQRGISTASFFEKSDFVKALADARVDGVGVEEEGYAVYTDVEVLTDDSSGPRQRSSSSDGDTRQQGTTSGGRGRASPFGAAGIGGTGGLGSIADLLNNMGMGGGVSAAGSPYGGAGANPFAGMGSNPFGNVNAVGKAQELMKNPNVMKLLMKAQGNPKIMAAMQECMSNPAAFAKYQNDPEVAELVNELKKYI